MSWLTAKTTSPSTSRSSESECEVQCAPLCSGWPHAASLDIDARKSQTCCGGFASADRSISVKYNMFDPANLDDDGLPLTIRAVFVICPQKKIKLILRVSPRASVHPFIHPFIHPSAVATVSNFSNHWIVGLLLGLLAQSTQRLWAATWTSSAAASRRCNCLMSTASPLPQTGRTCVSRLQLPPLRFAARFVCD